MKKSLTILAFLLPIIFIAPPAHAEWTKVTEDTSGNSFYIDYERIRKQDGYIYVWQLTDLLKPAEEWGLSIKEYYQVSCERFEYKVLSVIGYKEAMGEGEVMNSYKPPAFIVEWEYVVPDTVIEILLEVVCKQ